MPNKAVLAFWGSSLCAIRGMRMSWPGFDYTDPEWERLAALSRGVSPARNQVYNGVNAALFIALAGAVMFGVFLPVASALFPVPAETPAYQFLLLLATFAALILGLGLPLSMRLAARLVADPAALAAVPDSPADAPLAARVRWQTWRMVLIMCGLLTPGALLLITYNISLGPAMTAVKWLAFGLMGLSSWRLRRGGPAPYPGPHSGS